MRRRVRPEAVSDRDRSRGAIATLITNGYLITITRIHALNAAGLDSLQISIDNVTPDAVSKRSLKVFDRKLRWLAEHAWFDVTANARTPSVRREERLDRSVSGEERWRDHL